MESTRQNFPPTPPASGPSLIERLVTSVFVKLLVILLLVLFLLIPLAWVKELIDERAAREREVSKEITSKWGAPQIISGPIIGIPYAYQYTTERKDEKEAVQIEKQTVSDYVFLAPQDLQVQSQVHPEVRKRGMYRSIVYDAVIDLRGKFASIDLAKLGLTAADLQWKEAKIFVGITDIRGLKSSPSISWKGHMLPLQVNTDVQLFEQQLFAPVDLSGEATNGEFNAKIAIRGSQTLTVFPTAAETSVLISGKWANPSFDGGFLPDHREVGNTDFSASWRIPSFSRKFPQQWTGARKPLYMHATDQAGFSNLEGSVEERPAARSVDFQISNIQDMVQVNFLETVNNYQRATRVAKYGILVILLTFAALFFTEILKKRPVHLIQYILIGCAMVLFYSLLLALSEHIGFNWSYLVAGIITTALIAFFIFGITKDKQVGLIFSGMLVVFYTFIYLLLQLQDYALLVGTLGILIILALLMRFSLKIDWYQFDKRS